MPSPSVEATEPPRDRSSLGDQGRSFAQTVTDVANMRRTSFGPFRHEPIGSGATSIAPWAKGLSWFWHLVDIIWVAVFLTIWVIR